MRFALAFVSFRHQRRRAGHGNDLFDVGKFSTLTRLNVSALSRPSILINCRKTQELGSETLFRASFVLLKPENTPLVVENTFRTQNSVLKTKTQCVIFQFFR